jgi:hypothetical protein
MAAIPRFRKRELHVTVCCDHCNNKQRDKPPYEYFVGRAGENIDSVRSRAKSEGWLYTGTHDFCPACLARGIRSAKLP